MPKSSPQKLAYQKERNAQPAEKKKRAMNNAARRDAMEKGLVRKGDGKDVDHRVPLDRGGSNEGANLRVVSAAKNRGWRGRDPKMYGGNR